MHGFTAGWVRRLTLVVLAATSTQTAGAVALLPGDRLDLAAAAAVTTLALPATAGEVLVLVAEERGRDVALRLLASDGRELARMDGPGNALTVERLSWRVTAADLAAGDTLGDAGSPTEAGGVLQLEVQAPGPGRGPLLMRLPAPADPDVEARIDAERAFASATAAFAATPDDGLAPVRAAFLAVAEQAGAAGDAWLAARATFSVAWLDGMLGDLAAAVANFEAAARGWQALGERRWLAATRRAMAGRQQRRGDHAGAAAALAESRALWEMLGEPASAIEDAAAEGWSRVATGEIATALAILEPAAARAAASELPGLAARVTNTLGLAHRADGNLPAAITSFEAAAARLHDDELPALAAEIEANRGNCLADLGELERALDAYRQAALRYTAAGDRRGKGQVLSYMGALRAILADHQGALTLYGEALAELAAIGHSYQAVVHHRIGSARAALGNLTGAIAAWEEALPIWRRHGLGWGEAMTEVELAGVLARRGEHDRARDLVSHGLAATRALGNVQRIAADEEIAAEVALAGGDHEAALAHGQAALAGWRESGAALREAGALARLARIERARGDLATARTRIEAAIALLERIRRGFLSDELRATYLAAVRGHYLLYLEILHALDRAEPQAGHAEAALVASEQLHARVLLDLLQRGRVELAADLPAELAARREALARRHAAAVAALIALDARNAGAVGRRAQLQQTLADLDAEREALEAELRQRAPRVATLLLPESASARAIRAQLAPGDLLVSYVLGEPHTFAVAADAHGVSVAALPPASVLESELTALRSALAQPGRGGLSALRTSGPTLYSQLLGPFADRVAAATRLLVVADGALALLPFEVLLTASPTSPDPAAWPYLLRHMAVVTLPSAAVLAELRGPRPQPDGPALVAFADPSLAGLHRLPAAAGGPSAGLLRGALARGQLAPLPGAGAEVTAVARLFPPTDVRLWQGDEARESTVKTAPEVRTARRLHFATHGLVSAEDPALSGLVLAQSADPGEDGLLTAGEVFDLRLAADQVVLSACQTALGRAVGGEGLIGLGRAFLHAGARRLLVSLWPVEDQATARLMVDLYRRAANSTDAAEALRQAKLARLADPGSAHPFYWAPFVLVGDPGAPSASGGAGATTNR